MDALECDPERHDALEARDYGCDVRGRRSNLVESAVAGPGLSARGPALVATGAAFTPGELSQDECCFVRVKRVPGQGRSPAVRCNGG